MGELVALESVAREHMGGAPGTGKWASETQPPREGAASGASGFDSSDAAPSSRDACHFWLALSTMTPCRPLRQ